MSLLGEFKVTVGKKLCVVCTFQYIIEFIVTMHSVCLPGDLAFPGGPVIEVLVTVYTVYCVWFPGNFTLPAESSIEVIVTVCAYRPGILAQNWGKQRKNCNMKNYNFSLLCKPCRGCKKYHQTTSRPFCPIKFYLISYGLKKWQNQSKTLSFIQNQIYLHNR